MGGYNRCRILPTRSGGRRGHQASELLRKIGRRYRIIFHDPAFGEAVIGQAPQGNPCSHSRRASRR